MKHGDIGGWGGEDSSHTACPHPPKKAQTIRIRNSLEESQGGKLQPGPLTGGAGAPGQRSSGGLRERGSCVPTLPPQASAASPFPELKLMGVTRLRAGAPPPSFTRRPPPPPRGSSDSSPHPPISPCFTGAALAPQWPPAQPYLQLRCLNTQVWALSLPTAPATLSYLLAPHLPLSLALGPAASSARKPLPSPDTHPSELSWKLLPLPPSHHLCVCRPGCDHSVNPALPHCRAAPHPHAQHPAPEELCAKPGAQKRRSGAGPASPRVKRARAQANG